MGHDAWWWGTGNFHWACWWGGSSSPSPAPAPTDTHTFMHFCEPPFHSPTSAQLCTALLQSSGLRATAPPGERCKGKLNVCCMLPRKGLGSIVPCPSAQSPSPLHCAQRRAESCLHVQCSQGAERLLPAADSADRSSQEIEL